jgi:hypothetical protein
MGVWVKEIIHPEIPLANFKSNPVIRKVMVPPRVSPVIDFSQLRAGPWETQLFDILPKSRKMSAEEQ